MFVMCGASSKLFPWLVLHDGVLCLAFLENVMFGVPYMLGTISYD